MTEQKGKSKTRRKKSKKKTPKKVKAIVNQKDRRRAQRLDLHFKIIYKLMPRKKILQETISQNVSGSGVRLRVNQKLELGTRLKAQLYLPNIKKPITALSKVVWRKESPTKKGYDVGIQHIKIDTKDKERFVFAFCEMMINYFMGT